MLPAAKRAPHTSVLSSSVGGFHRRIGRRMMTIHWVIFPLAGSFQLQGFKLLLIVESPLAFRQHLIFTEAEPLGALCQVESAWLPRPPG